jgi:hypothetical protein
MQIFRQITRMEETLWETKHRIEDIFKMDLKEMG